MRLPAVVGVAAGLATRHWWYGLTAEAKGRYADAVWSNRLFIALAVAAGLGLFAAFLWKHTELDPRTGGRRLFLFSDRALERQADRRMQETLDSTRPVRLDAAHPVHGRVAGATSRMLAANAGVDAIRRRRWTVAVVDSPAVNAAVAPGGLVLVNTGLTSAANDDQLSIVVGHEMAHCLLRHVNQISSIAFVLDTLCLVPVSAVIWAALPFCWNLLAHLWSVAVLNVCVVLPCARWYEAEADRAGLELAARACVDVTQGYRFWDAMSETEGPGYKLFWWLSVHPTNESRSRHLYGLIPAATELRRLASC
ncbi:metalloendopeptidase OMA1, mitochondrial-like [Melanaphis sacchari]|uniref:metalloendopeptidase OMA1, mitochondrial-like n=1 Tax=Melanaphis sacchari TaxID=742174 RepID=UPI000DC1584E|nr:metalloendopeptidase OMA1, mitochondrial-like [Melanaphis sacchari]